MNQRQAYSAGVGNQCGAGIGHKIDVLERQAVGQHFQALHWHGHACTPVFCADDLAGFQVQFVRGNDFAGRQPKHIIRANRFGVSGLYDCGCLLTRIYWARRSPSVRIVGWISESVRPILDRLGGPSNGARPASGDPKSAMPQRPAPARPASPPSRGSSRDADVSAWPLRASLEARGPVAGRQPSGSGQLPGAEFCPVHQAVGKGRPSSQAVFAGPSASMR